jgi:hypothetical protein
MNPKVKEKWVAALRSGKYKQARGALCKDGAYCCLGVLCDLYRKAKKKRGVGFKPLVQDDGSISPTKRFFDNKGKMMSDVPTDDVAEWAGISSCNPLVKTSETSAEFLAVLNDERKKTFPEIADLIEAQL